MYMHIHLQNMEIVLSANVELFIVLVKDEWWKVDMPQPVYKRKF
jgi:hypothetical protein